MVIDNDNDEKFECESCGEYLNIEDQCDHDQHNQHTWCMDCCVALSDRPIHYDKDDLD